MTRHGLTGMPKFAGVAVGGFLFGLMAVVLLSGLLALCNPGAFKRPRGLWGLLGAASEGLLLLLPFTILALLAELLLGWNAAQAFAAAGLMASAPGMGAAAMKRGGNRWANLILPSLAGLALSAAWMLLCALAVRLGGHR